MKNIINTLLRRPSVFISHHATKCALLAAIVSLSAYGWSTAICMAQQADTGEQGAQVLTRGPVHEAFAGIVTFNPQAGIVVSKTPPALIEEIPPSERPAGNNITWIPGYWAWDDERSDFLWVSGTWRALPPGRQWIAGYWSSNPKGYQWTSGYWADSAVAETTYLPEPPATVEDGPNTEAPSQDYGWTPGSWMWDQERYAWSPGYWAQGRANWDWTPSHYVWSPRGYIYVGGFWDYPVERRGMLFAPVYFDSGVYAHAGYNYSPAIVIDLGLLAENLFLRPRYNHYYFGDYYDSGYDRGGYYAAVSYHNRNGYDPIYAQQRWQHRKDAAWNQNAVAAYQYRRDNVNARPARTYAAMSSLVAGPSTKGKPNRMMLAVPITQAAKLNGGAVEMQAVGKKDRQMLTQRSQQVQQSRDQRRTSETQGAGMTAPQAGQGVKVTSVKLPPSPIVAKSASQMPKGQAPPKVLRAPQVDLTKKSNSGPVGGQPKAEQSNPQPGQNPATAHTSKDGQQPQQPGAKQQPEQPRAKQQPQQPGAKQQPEQSGAKQQPEQPRAKQQPQQPGAKQQPEQPRAKQQPQQPGAKQQPQQPGAKQQPQQPGPKQQPEQPRAKQQPEQPRAKQQPEQPGAKQQPQQPRAKQPSAQSGKGAAQPGNKDKNKDTQSN